LDQRAAAHITTSNAASAASEPIAAAAIGAITIPTAACGSGLLL